MGNYYFLEHFNDKLNFNNGEIIAFTPEVMYELDKRNIPYKTIEDYVRIDDQPDLTDYRESFSNLILECDKYVQGKDYRINKKSVKDMFLLNSFFLNSLLSSIVLIAYTVEKLITQINPSKVIFIKKQSTFGMPDYCNLNKRNMIGFQDSPYYLFSKKICEQLGITFSVINLKHKAFSKMKWRVNIFEKNMRIFSVKFLKFIKRFFRKPFFRSKNSNQLNLLRLFFTDDSFDSVLLIKRAKNLGVKSFVDDSSMLKSHLFQKTLNLVGIKRKELFFLSKQDRDVISKKMIKWLNRYSQIDVSSFLEGNIDDFLKDFYEKTFSMARYYADFYEKNKINYVIAPCISTKEQYTAFFAAGLTRMKDQPKRVLIWHGSSVHQVEPAHHLDIQCADLVFVPNKEMLEYVKTFCLSISSQFPNKFRVFQGSPNTQSYIEFFRKNRNLQQNQYGGKKEKLVCCYIHAFYYGSRRRLEKVDYSDTWYYRLQKKIIEYFSKRKDVHFIYKTLSNIHNPILSFLGDGRFTNIEVSREPLQEVLKRVDCTFSDTPSSGFYQSQLARIPSLAIYPSFGETRKSALDLFGDSVFIFKECEEAISALDSFLSSPDESYLADIPFDRENILQTLYQEMRIR